MEYWTESENLCGMQFGKCYGPLSELVIWTGLIVYVLGHKK